MIISNKHHFISFHVNFPYDNHFLLQLKLDPQTRKTKLALNDFDDDEAQYKKNILVNSSCILLYITLPSTLNFV